MVNLEIGGLSLPLESTNGEPSEDGFVLGNTFCAGIATGLMQGSSLRIGVADKEDPELSRFMHPFAYP